MFTVIGEVWRYPGAGGWHFVTLPPDVADEVRARSVAQAVRLGRRAGDGGRGRVGDVAVRRHEERVLPAAVEGGRAPPRAVEAGDTVT